MIERGERLAHVETLAALADALGVSLAELFAGTDSRSGELDEVIRPLSDFFRLRSLSSKEVDRLLCVARAMFDGPSDATAS
jgi:transcriptional regulator with XRE-family HTH domain